MKRILFVSVAAMLVVGTVTLAFIAQRRELAQAREIVAKRDLYCEWHRFLILDQRKVLGVATSSPRDRKLAETVGTELNGAIADFKKYVPIEPLLRLCGELDQSVLDEYSAARDCWIMSNDPSCFQKAVEAVARNLCPPRERARMGGACAM